MPTRLFGSGCSKASSYDRAASTSMGSPPRCSKAVAARRSYCSTAVSNAGGVYWTPVVSRLVEHHRVVIPDAPGLGESAPAARLDQATFDRWFAELLRLRCPDPPVVVAHSLLGSMAASAACRAPGAAATPRHLRRAGSRALPDATRTAGRGRAFRRATDCAQRGAIRPLRLVRLRRDPASRRRVVRRVLRLHDRPGEGPPREGDDAQTRSDRYGTNTGCRSPADRCPDGAPLGPA